MEESARSVRKDKACVVCGYRLAAIGLLACQQCAHRLSIEKHHRILEEAKPLLDNLPPDRRARVINAYDRFCELSLALSNYRQSANWMFDEPNRSSLPWAITPIYHLADGTPVELEVENFFQCVLAYPSYLDFDVSDKPSRSPYPLKPAEMRHKLGEECGWICVYCQKRGTNEAGPDGRTWHVDHIFAESNGGDCGGDNFVLACASCNLHKHNRLISGILTKLHSLLTTEPSNVQ